MIIPFVDLKSQYLSIKSQIDLAIQTVINETTFIGGKPVKEFEKKFSELYNVKHVIPCANGTDSLYIIMKMLGIKSGDEVITVANSWISSSETISQVGAKPVFVDISPSFYSIDEDKIEEKINSNTKALIVVHLQGQMCQMDKIVEICNRNKIYLIEDCAQAHFSSFDGKYAGLFGIASSFSFFPGKNLGAYGDAGCIITNDDILSDKFRMFANHGSLIKHNHKIEGINSRMDAMQASILTAKIPHILTWTNKRRLIANKYNVKLGELKSVTIPNVRKNSLHSFHLYVVKVEKRDELRAFLQNKGIETLVHYPTPLPLLEAYKYLNYDRKDFPVSCEIQNKILSLPIYPELTDDMIDYICNSIAEFYNSKA
jgi:dTDP-4-amino-4,6-dideoxygalactose transaminase